MSFITKAIGGLAKGLGLVDEPKAPPPPPPAPTVSDPSVQDVADKDRKRLAAMNGRASTILSSPLKSSMEDQTSASKTLFGA